MLCLSHHNLRKQALYQFTCVETEVQRNAVSYNKYFLSAHYKSGIVMGPKLDETSQDICQPWPRLPKCQLCPLIIETVTSFPSVSCS